jgi:hypothetical protein
VATRYYFVTLSTVLDFLNFFPRLTEFLLERYNRFVNHFPAFISHLLIHFRMVDELVCSIDGLLILAKRS